jgi:hypothetical protein
MRKFLTSGRRRYALALVVVAVSFGVMGAKPQPLKPPPNRPTPNNLSARPMTVNFQNEDVGGLDTATVTVSNNGPGTSGPLAVALQGADVDSFGLFGPPCAGETLAPSGSGPLASTCGQNVFFSPTKPGPLSATLVVTASPGGSVTVTLRGTAFEPPD